MSGKQQLCVPFQFPEIDGPAYTLLELVGFSRSLQRNIEAANSSSTESDSNSINNKRSTTLVHKEAAAGTCFSSKKQKRNVKEEHLEGSNDVKFVQVDSSSFRELVQQLTGAGSDCKDKMPVTQFKCTSRMRRSLDKLENCKRNKIKGAAAAAVPSPKSPLAADPFGYSPSNSDVECGVEEGELRQSCATDFVKVEEGSEVRCSLHFGARVPRLLPLFPLTSSSL